MANRHLMVVGAYFGRRKYGGAVMLKHKKAGWDVTIVHVTAGEKGHPTLPPEEYIKMRHADAKASGEFIELTWRYCRIKMASFMTEESICRG
jgi:LmbE family N-acetylglucosaminyl deacetylase